MAQKFLISTDKAELDAIRTDFLENHHDVCVPHKENGCWYADVVENVYDPTSGKEWMLCILDTAEQYLSEEQVNSLLTEIPNNFIDNELI